MTATSASPHRVLIVDNDDRVRRALTELINATEGFAVIAVEGAQGAAPTPTDEATVALVALRSISDHAGLERVRELSSDMAVVAVSSVSSVAAAAARAGAVAFCEMDGNTDVLITALRVASGVRGDETGPRQAAGRQPIDPS